MTRILFILALYLTGCLISMPARAQSVSTVRSPQSKAEYCSTAKAPAQFVALAAMDVSRIAFENPYGYFSTGLCWWHSHLQRAAIYLTYYDPAAPKPTSLQAYGLLKNIYYHHAVTRIPGYANFHDFTLDNQKLVTDFLSDVEILATAGGDWVHGVVGHSQVSAAGLKLKMDQLYQAYRARPALIYQMLQMPGMDAHAWLVQSITPAPQGGYTLSVIDSNFPAANGVYNYVVGQTQLPYDNDATASFVPYTYDQGQLDTFAARAVSFCK